MKKVIFIVLIFTIIISAPGCFPTHKNENELPAGFFTGIWHGWIAPVSLVFGLFNSDIRMYETNNTGWAYDFGFYIAVIAGFGGLALRRKKSDS